MGEWGERELSGWPDRSQQTDDGLRSELDSLNEIPPPETGFQEELASLASIPKESTFAADLKSLEDNASGGTDG